MKQVETGLFTSLTKFQELSFICSIAHYYPVIKFFWPAPAHISIKKDGVNGAFTVLSKTIRQKY